MINLYNSKIIKLEKTVNNNNYVGRMMKSL